MFLCGYDSNRHNNIMFEKKEKGVALSVTLAHLAFLFLLMHQSLIFNISLSQPYATKIIFMLYNNKPSKD